MNFFDCTTAAHSLTDGKRVWEFGENEWKSAVFLHNNPFFNVSQYSAVMECTGYVTIYFCDCTGGMWDHKP
jgi:hypothetical protein